MAITRTDINGDFTALKNALATLVPDFFASVTLDSDTITCKDADDNTIFTIKQGTNTFAPTAYRSADSGLTPTGGSYLTIIKYFFKVGTNGAFITYNFGEAVIIAKAKNGKTAVAIPASSGTSATGRISTLYAACWGDDTEFNNPIQIAAGTTNTCTGNHTQFVPIPLYGTYTEANQIEKAYYMPMAQPNQRGVVQELVDDLNGERYITNGYVAMLDD